MEQKTSILKKITSDGEMMVYLRCRDYASIKEPVDGGVAVSVEYLKGRKVFGQLVAHFRFGREKDEIMGLKFYKSFVLVSQQIYPPVSGEEELTSTQIAIKCKGNSKEKQVFPFKFHFPEAAPMSVFLLAKNVDVKNACGIRYYVSVFVADNENDIKHKRNLVELGVRRIQYAPVLEMKKAPRTLIRENFVACYGNVELETTLDKLIFETNEKIPIYISVQNNSHKIVRKLKVTLFQNVKIRMLQNGQYKRVINEEVTSKGFPVQPGASQQIIILLVAKLIKKRMKDGIALDGRHKFAECDLASSTFLHSYPVIEAFGIIVSYFIRVKLYLGPVPTSICADLPVVMMPTKVVDNSLVKT